MYQKVLLWVMLACSVIAIWFGLTAASHFDVSIKRIEQRQRPVMSIQWVDAEDPEYDGLQFRCQLGNDPDNGRDAWGTFSRAEVLSMMPPDDSI